MVVVDRPIGRGTTYTVTSRQVPTTYSQLRTLGTLQVPESILEQYAEPPVTTARTAALARELTADLDSNLDKIEAISDWMDANTAYSLDAPLSPRGVDVVDHFLFQTRLGWCEQIASSLVVMARVAGVPARLATGFVPGTFDDVSGRFIVREREAHAWAEVWFPDVGWVPFDPTATVPLAGDSSAAAATAGSGRSQVIGFLLLVVALALVALRPLLHRIRHLVRMLGDRRDRRRLLAERWDVREEASIEAAGEGLGRPRRPAETLSGYTSDLVGMGAPAELGQRAERVELFRYGRPAPARDPTR